MKVTQDTQVGVGIGTAAVLIVAIVAAVWGAAEAEDRIDNVEQAVQSLANIEQADRLTDDAMRDQVDELKAQTRGLQEGNDLLRQMLLLQEGRVQYLERQQMRGPR